MRVPILLSFCALASVAVAQQKLTDEELLARDAYDNLRANDTMTFDLRGTDTYGTRTTPLHATLIYRLSTDPRSGRKSKAEVEVDIYEPTTTGETVTTRIVGDGKALYRYDLTRGTVSTTTYGYYGDSEPPSYVGSDAPKLFNQLRAVVPGSANYLARLLFDLDPAGALFANRFSSWLPGYPATAPKATEILYDPIVPSRSYGGDGSTYVLYGVRDAATARTLAFRIDDRGTPGVPDWEVGAIAFASRTARNVLEFTIIPSVATVPNWAFVPYVANPLTGRQFQPVNHDR